MSELAIRHASTDNAPRDFTPAVLDLLSAIREALNLPYAATDDADRLRARVLGDRLIDVAAVLNTIVQYPTVFEPAEQAAKLRQWTAESPANYPAARLTDRAV